MRKSNIILALTVLIASVSYANAFSLFGFGDNTNKSKRTENPSEVFAKANPSLNKTIQQGLASGQLHINQDIKSSEQTQISRYVSQKEEIPESKQNLLDQNISVEFDSNVETLRDAINQLLLNSGYRLRNINHQDKYIKAMLANPLPATQRTIQNATLKQALLMLTGHQFIIQLDPINRIIDFKIRPTVLAIYLNNQGVSDESN